MTSLGSIPRRWTRSLAIPLALWACTSKVRAHGDPPAVTDLLSVDAEGAKVVSLTEGLAVRLAEGWHFVCPAAFGSALPPLALSADGSQTWVVGAEDLFLLDGQGQVHAQGQSELDSATVVALAADRDSVYALRFAAEGSEVVRLEQDQAAVVHVGNEPWTSVAFDGRSLWLSRLDSDSLRLLELSPEGDQRDLQSIVLEGAWLSARLRAASDGLYVALRNNQEYRVAAVEPGATRPLFTAPVPIEGPAHNEGGGWLSSGGALMRLGSDVPEPFELEDRITCLGNWHEQAFVCDQTRMRALDEAGPSGTLFELAELQGPLPSEEGAELSRECRDQWTLFRGDLGRIGIDVADGGVETDGSMATGGCAALGAKASPSGPWLLPLGWAAWAVRRRRLGAVG